MIWLLGIYMWLYIHRPFEVWPWLGALQIERIYMVALLVVWAGYPGKVFTAAKTHLALLFFSLVLLASWVTSPYAQEEGVTVTVENYAKTAVFYLLVVTTVRNEAELKRLLLCYLAAFGLYTAHSILEFMNGRYNWAMGITRMVGVDVTHGDPNGFAASLLFTLPLTLPFWNGKTGLFGKVFLAGYCATLCGCVLLTGSRAGLVGLLAVGLMFALGAGKRRGLFLLLGTAGFLALLILPGSLQNRFMTLIDPSVGPANAQGSAEGRVAGLVFGYMAWQQSPLLGHGPNCFAFATGRAGGAHNLYGQVLAEMGLLGALALLALLFCFWRNALEARRFYRRRPGQPRGLPYHTMRALSMCVVLLILLGWSGHTLYRYNWLWAAAFQTVALSCVRLQAVRAQAAVRVRPAPAAGPRPAPALEGA
jgi:O-antigen ligase